MKIVSSAFEYNQNIPNKYTCDGENINPPLQFLDIPENAKSLVLIVDDPDAPMGTWVHWVIFNIDPKTSKIEENSKPETGIEGVTDFSRTGWGGPCPPAGSHRYFFKLYALDKMLNLTSSVGKREVEEAINNHTLQESELVGLYSRSK